MRRSRVRYRRLSKGRVLGVYRPSRAELEKITAADDYLRSVVAGVLHQQGVEEPDTFEIVPDAGGHPKELKFVTEAVP